MRKPFLGLCFLIMTAACANEDAKRDKQRAEIHKLEVKMLKLDQLDTALANEMLKAYDSYLNAYPKDSLSPRYQQKVAELYRAYPGKRGETIEAYEKLIQEYTYYPEGSNGMLSLALYYEEIQEKDMALETYELFIERFPSHPLADQARELRDLLANENLTDIELVQQWMRKAKDSTQNSEK